MSIEFNYANLSKEEIEHIIGMGKEWDDKSDEITLFKNKLYEKLQNNILCPYCRKRLKRNKGDEIDHIIYKADYKNFLFQPQNLILACRRCNRYKSNKNVLKEEYRESVKLLNWDEYPLDKEKYNIIHPYVDTYSDHITIKNDFFYIPQKNSIKGGNTIEMLGLNKFAFVEEKVKESSTYENLIRSSINDPANDSFIKIWACFLLEPPKFQKIIFDILLSFESSNYTHIILQDDDYTNLKKAISEKSVTTTIPFCNPTNKFVKIINELEDNTLIEKLILQFEGLYCLADFNKGFKSCLFIASILLIRLDAGKYNKANRNKYLTG